jgi:hypothetical protein
MFLVPCTLIEHSEKIEAKIYFLPELSPSLQPGALISRFKYHIASLFAAADIAFALSTG